MKRWSANNTFSSVWHVAPGTPQVSLQVASLENALSQAQGRLAEHSSGTEVRAARAEQDRWRWQSEAEELRTLLASRDREIGKMQSKQEVF